MEAEKLAKFTAIRRELHQYPELSLMEHETHRRIVSYLRDLGVEQVHPVATTGVLAIFDGAQHGKTILLRADLDALPIQETNTFDHRSKVSGVSHACGHDGHSATLLAVAAELVTSPLQSGTVLLLFQPAEENGYGAKSVLSDPSFHYQPDYVFALHNVPGFPLKEVVVKENAFTPAVTSAVIKLHGKTAHAAEPEMGQNPAKAIAQLVAYFESLECQDQQKDNFALATPVHLHMGEQSYGVSAGYGEVHYTLRTWKNDLLQQLKTNTAVTVSQIASQNGLTADLTWLEEFASNQNDATAVDSIRNAVKTMGLSIHEKQTPFKWGEDFGLFTEHFKGAMFGLGAGEDQPALHNPDYDFPDELIATGSELFLQIIDQVLNA